MPLTPGRSVAVDPAFVPFGAPVRRLLHAQDTGGAMRETAEVFVLLPRELTAGGVDPGGAAALLPEAPAGP